MSVSETYAEDSLALSPTEIMAYNNNWNNGPPRKMFRGNNPNVNNQFMHFLARNSNRDFFQPPPYIMQAPPPPPDDPLLVNCGELREKDHGMIVEMFGKVVKQRMGRFLQIKDLHGVTQLVAPNQIPSISNSFNNIPIDSYIRIIGRVQARPRSSKNTSIATGGVEVHVKDILHVKTPTIPLMSMGMEQKRSYSTSSVTSSVGEKRGITRNELKKIHGSEGIMKYFENRQYTCGELRLHHVNKEIILVGWLDSAKKFGRFVQLRDGHGYVQIVLDNTDFAIVQQFDSLTEDDILLIKGIVTARPLSSQNRKIETGEIEVNLLSYKILKKDDPYEGPVRNEERLVPEVVQAREENQKELKNLSNVPKTNEFTYRTHNCGELNEKNIGENVTLCGWLEYERMKKFLTLRDGYGSIQVIVPEELSDTLNIDSIPYESILKVKGIVTGRPVNMCNNKMLTGSIEIVLSELEVLNQSKKNLPIEVRNFNRSKESLRMEYRYIDLRFADMQANLRTRSNVFMKMREFLVNNYGFVDVETPTLFRRTPGGAQEFVVPTRKPGHFYSLVQSPQQFKQMLMAGAIDRYFQIARCYRDEATRPDRQPEFTQLDIELSFTNQEGIFDLIEKTLAYSWPKDRSNITIPFPRMTFNEAMELYGSDKPDLRFDVKLRNVTNLLLLNETLSSMCQDFAAYSFVFKKPNSIIPTSLKNAIKELIKEAINCRVFLSKVKQPKIEDWMESEIANALTTDVTKSLAANLNLEPDDLLILGIGSKRAVQTVMGKIRLAFVENLEERDVIPKRQNTDNKFVWILDFPMFTKNEETNQLETTHHPFTAPHPDDEEQLQTKCDLELVRSQSYDLVLNGQEIGGGSIRIHNADMQRMVLKDILNIEHSHLQHLLNALESGCPPHGGIALGLDRLMSVICNTKSIRDVIAFPKGMEGKDHMSKAPVPISDEELQLYSIDIKKVENKADDKKEKEIVTKSSEIKVDES